MNLFEISNEFEFNALKDTYGSEGFRIYMRLIDSLIATQYNKITDDKTSNDDILMLVNQIKGLSKAKESIFNALKENEHKFERKG